MSVESASEETELFLEAYARYRNRYVESVDELWLAPFYHIETAGSVSMDWGPYHEMVRDHARELANELNQFSQSIERLRCWGEILPEYEQRDRMALTLEFVEPLAICCVNYPYAIRSRFIFSIAHLSHQANKAVVPGWHEGMLPDDGKINYKTMEGLLREWPRYEDILALIGQLSDRELDRATAGFRHKFHHRYPPRFEHGMTQTVSRERGEGGKTVYAFGYVEPLSVCELAPILRKQHTVARECFDCYTELVREQLARIYES